MLCPNCGASMTVHDGGIEYEYSLCVFFCPECEYEYDDTDYNDGAMDDNVEQS